MSEFREIPKDTASSATAPVERPHFGPDGPSREVAAAWLLNRRASLKRQAVRALKKAGALGIDPEDVLSSGLRRIDLMLLRRVVRADNEGAFWLFAIGVLHNVVLMRLRAQGREQVALGSRRANSRPNDGLRTLVARFAACADDDHAAVLLHQMLMALTSDDDRELLFWKVHDKSWDAISEATGRSVAALKVQWVRICRRLREWFPAQSRRQVRVLGGGGRENRAD